MSIEKRNSSAPRVDGKFYFNGKFVPKWRTLFPPKSWGGAGSAVAGRRAGGAQVVFGRAEGIRAATLEA
jgi:hypothetical protein